MPSQPKRFPGEKNPGLDTHDVDQLTNTALSDGSSSGTYTGVSAGLLGLFASWRTKRAKKRAMAAHEAQRHQDEDRG